jgi:hypothetical protein
MSEWQPIETAPKGKRFLCNDSSYDGEWLCIAEFEDGHIVNTDYRRGVVNPTHWMPLPTPPENN